MAWRRGKVSSERYQTGPSYTNHPTCTPHVYTYIRRGVSFKRHAKGSGTEEKGMRRQDELVSFTGLVRRSSADGTDSYIPSLISHPNHLLSLSTSPPSGESSIPGGGGGKFSLRGAEKGGASMPPSRFHSKIHERVQIQIPGDEKKKRENLNQLEENPGGWNNNNNNMWRGSRAANCGSKDIYTYIRGTGRRERFTALALLQPRSEIRNRLRSLLLH